jgi:Ca-activated chloride channel family protein
MSQSTPQFSASWERRHVSLSGDRTALLVRISTPTAAHIKSHPPVDVAFALDRSGSMSGAPIDLVKQAVDIAARMLRPQDQTALVVYDDRIDVLHTLQPASASSRSALRRALDGIEARGSTNLGDGWLTACQQLANSELDQTGTGHRLRRSLLLTDGLANVGITDMGQLVDHAHQLRKRGITTSTLGVGEGFDEGLLSSMAEAGGGNFQFIPEPAGLPAFFERELGGMLSTAAANLRLIITLPGGMRGTLISAFPCERRHKTFDVTIGDVSAGDEVMLIFDVTTPIMVEGESRAVALRVEWIDPDTSQSRSATGSTDLLTACAPTVAAGAPVDQTVAEQSALQHAAQEQREAMRLDREGRYRESRNLHRSAQSILAAAPQTGTVSDRLAEAAGYASYDLDAAFPETVRKQSVHNTMRRARGRSDAS